MNDKKYLVIGAAGLIGKELVYALVLKGANVIAADLSVEVIKKNIPKTIHEKISVVEIDITSKVSIQKVLKYCESSLGELDGAVNTSYPKTSSYGKDIFQMSFEEFNSNVSVHLGGYFLFMQQCALFAQRQKKDFSLVNLASIYGVVAPDQRIYEGSFHEQFGNISTPAVYSVSKFAVIGLTKYLATYWGGMGVRSNTLTPGGIELGHNEEFVRRYSDRVPLGKMGVPQDVCGALKYLASDESSYVNGQNIIVDGGLTTW